MAACGLRIVALMLVLLCVLLCCTQNAGQSVGRNNRRGNRRQGGGRGNGGINQDLLDAYREVYQGLPSTTAPPTSAPQQFGAIPPLPNPEDVECFVEITTVQRQGGLCGQFGGGNGSSPYYCQRGDFTEMQPECGAIVRARIARAARGSHEARTPRGQN